MGDHFISSLGVKVLDADLQKLASNFSCGNSSIDSFIKSPQAIDNGIGTTYVWLGENDSEIIGFYNITTGGVDQYDEYGNFKIGGAVHINEFAMHIEYQKVVVDQEARTYLSDLLLADCLERIKFIRQEFLGFSFITLHSTQEGHYLYSRNDFIDIEEDMRVSQVVDSEVGCISMYLPLDIEY